LVARMPRAGQVTLSFSLREEAGADYCLAGSPAWLTAHGEPLLALSELALTGRHNAANALAALALAEALALPRGPVLATLREFAGLPHRMQPIAEVRGVRYIDDSKGTNVGATLAAVRGLTESGAAAAPTQLILIAGGEGKEQDFTPLAAALAGRVQCVLLIGRDAARLAAVLAPV